MSQRLRLRLALALQWGLAALFGHFLVRIPWAAALASAPLLAGLGVSAVLAAEFAIAPRAAAGVDGPGGGSARRLGALRAWGGEVVAHLRAFWWLQPFRASPALHAPQAREPSAGAARHAVLLVHGFGCNASMWLPLLESGCLDGAEVAAVDLEPPCASIEEHAIRLDRALRQLALRAGVSRVAVVAHSMGGLAMLACLRRHPDSPAGPLVAIGTPFGGAWVARWLPCEAARQMRLDSAWRGTLVAGVDPAVSRRLLCVASRQDNIVVPRAGATLAGAPVLQFDGRGHLALASDPSVLRAVREWALAPPGLPIPHCDKIAV